MIASLARLGYASKAVIYALVGTLAAAAAVNRGGRITDRSGALRVILTQPFGNAILLVLAVGLCGYSAWRILDALFDPDRHGTRVGGLITRIGNVVRAAIYGMLGLEAFRLARGLRASGGSGARMWAARVMDLPLGDWLIGLVGVIVVAYGISQMVTAAREKVGKRLDVTPLPRSMRTALINIGRFGVAARAVIIVVLGIFLIRAALQHDPSEAGGIRESLLELGGMVEGRWILALIALGLVAYGVDQALHARCRRIRSPI
jgi:uncharacterized protein DUF1206